MLNVLRRLLARRIVHPELLREVRFPYLDRDFLEFLYAIPREQIVGVGKRRFLMKRALVGIVPDELLSRRRKADVRSKLQKDSCKWAGSMELGPDNIGSSAGIVDPNQFLEALRKAQRNEDVPDVLRRTLTLESWLRHLTIRGVLTNSVLRKKEEYSRHPERLPGDSKRSEDRGFSAGAASGEFPLVPLGVNETQSSAQPKSSAS